MRIVSFAFKDKRSPLNEAAYVRCHRGAVRLLFLLSTAINPARAAQIQATTARTASATTVSMVKVSSIAETLPRRSQ
jgi:hypothetical protein